MLEFLKKLYRLISSLFGDNVPEGVAWDRIPPELMTPRERLLRRSSLIMFWGALLNFIAAVFVVGVAIHAGSRDATVFAALQEAALSRFYIDADTAALADLCRHRGERGDSAGAGGGDYGAGAVDGLHRLAADRGESGGACSFLASRRRCWRWRRWSRLAC